MGAYRLATLDDASRLYHIRRRSILELAPPSMPAVEAEIWAAKLTRAGMERKLRELEVWVAEPGGTVAGWDASRDNLLEGLYTAPEFAGRGIGAGLLERLMRERGFPSVYLEASPNARGFYLRRGYRATGPQTPQGAWPMVKEHFDWRRRENNCDGQRPGTDSRSSRSRRLIFIPRGATLTPA
jgi:putative acetyltransferase